MRGVGIRKISSANTLMEKSVTGKEGLVFWRVERNATRSVNRGVDDGEVGEGRRKGFLRGEKGVWGGNWGR